MPEQTKHSWDEVMAALAAQQNTAPAQKTPEQARSEAIGMGGTAEKWLKDKLVGGAVRRGQQLIALPKTLIDAFMADPAQATVDVGEGLLTAPYHTVKNVLTHPVKTFQEDPLQILEALSVASAAKRGVGKLASTYVKPLTQKALEAKSAKLTTQVYSPTKQWKTNNPRMRTQEAGVEHVPANAMPGYRLQQMAERLAPERQGILRRKANVRPALTDDFMQRIDDQVITPAEAAASAKIAGGTGTITATEFLNQAQRVKKGQGLAELEAMVTPENADAFATVIENFRTRSPHGVLHDATPGVLHGEVMDDIAAAVAPQSVSALPKQLNASNAGLLRVPKGYKPADVVDDVDEMPATPGLPPDIDARARSVELPITEQQLDIAKKALNRSGSNKFGRDVTDAQFYARDKLRGDIKAWLEAQHPAPGGTADRSTMRLPKNFDEMSLRETNQLEGDAIALQKMMGDRFQQLASAPQDNSYRMARLVTGIARPFTPATLNAAAGMALSDKGLQLRAANQFWEQSKKSGRAAARPWMAPGTISRPGNGARPVVDANVLAALVSGELDQSQERHDPWAAILDYLRSQP